MNKRIYSMENEKMTFGDYYRSLNDPKTELIEQIMKATRSSENTVRKWIAGLTTPPPVKQEIVSKLLGRPMNELFPAKLMREDNL